MKKSMTLVMKDSGVMRPLEPHEFQAVLDLINAEMADAYAVAKLFRDNPQFTEWVAGQ